MHAAVLARRKTLSLSRWQASQSRDENERKRMKLDVILLDANIDISRYILIIDTSTLTSSNMDRREYIFIYGSKKRNTETWKQK
jgi:hypothetical protein